MTFFSKLYLRSHVRLFLIFILTFIVPLTMLTVLFLYSYRNIYINEIQQASCREMDTVATTMNTQCQAAATYLSMISQDADLIKHLSASAYSDYPLPAGTASLEEIVQRYATGTPSLLNTQVIILSAAGDVLYGREYLGMLTESVDFYNAIHGYRSPMKSTVWFSDQHIRNVPAGSSYIYVARSTADTSNNWKTLGHVILRFRNSDLISIYLNSASEFRSIFILDASANVISSIDNLAVQSSVVEPNKRQFLLSNTPIKKGSSVVYTSQLLNLWSILSVTKPGASTQSYLTGTIALYTLALLLCIFFTLTVAYFVSKRFMVPVKVLITHMQEVECGNFHSRAVIHTHDEFEELANSYNKMIQRVEDLMQQIIFEQEEKRKSDIRMLQAQINPHFLYNTLASVRYMIYTAPPKEVDRMLLALGRFLKYVLSNADTVYVTLDHEFEQMDNYITIQQFGFEAELRYEVDIEEHLGHCLVVKMLFQPLIENALLHGLKLNSVDPVLHIRVTSEGTQTVQIEISDNGAGFDVFALSEPQKPSGNQHHLGISNVRQRLRLHYGENYLFEINSVKGKGTVVRIQIPKLTEEGMYNENFNR